MSELKKIIVKIPVLVLDILLFALQTVKQIILPNRRRKGNILSSLFDFFIGTLERIFHFEHGFFRMAVLFKHKYCRQGLIIITTLLFLISSFEWSGLEKSDNETGRYSEQLRPGVAERITVKQAPHNHYTKNAGLIKTYSAKHHIVYSYITPQSPQKKYLFIRSFLI